MFAKRIITSDSDTLNGAFFLCTLFVVCITGNDKNKICISLKQN